MEMTFLWHILEREKGWKLRSWVQLLAVSSAVCRMRALDFSRRFMCCRSNYYSFEEGHILNTNSGRKAMCNGEDMRTPLVAKTAYMLLLFLDYCYRLNFVFAENTNTDMSDTGYCVTLYHLYCVYISFFHMCKLVGLLLLRRKISYS